MTEFPPAPPENPTWGQPVTPQPPQKSNKKRNIIIGVVVGVLAIGAIGAVASPDGQQGVQDGLAAGLSTAEPTTEPTTEATAEPTAEPTAKPTVVPTPVPTPEPAQPITLDEINAALATEDCETIIAVGSEERIEVTTDSEVLMAGIDAVGRCLTGEYVAPTSLVPLGTSAVADNWKIKVTGKPNFDAWKVVKRENMFNSPAPRGWKMVLIPLAFTNVGEEKDSLLGLGEYVYGEGTLVQRSDVDDPTCGVIPKEIDFFTDVRPGGTLKGNMCFVVENSDVKTLRFAAPQGMFSDQPDVEFALR